MPIATETIGAARRTAQAVRALAHLTRPAITDLNTADLYDLSGALAELVAALPQVLTQLARYPSAHDAGDGLAHASRIAAELAAVLDTTHQTLDETVENIKTEPRGGQFSTVDRGSVFGRR